MATKKANQTGLTKLRDDEKKSWFSIALIWAGAVVCVPPLMVGGFMVTTLGFNVGVAAMIFSYIFCVFFMILMSFQAVDLGLPTVIMVSGAYGKKGSRFVISSILTITYIAWFGMQAAVCGMAFSGLLALWGINIPGWVSIAVWGVVMTITAIRGIDSIKLLSMFAVPLLIIAVVYSLIYTLSDPGNLARVAEYRPEFPVSFWAGASMSIGGFAGFTVFSGDFTRFAKSRKDVVISSIVGVIPSGVLLLLAGGILAISTGALGFENELIVNMLSSMGTPLIGLFVLIFATWTTNVATAFSSSFALLNLTGQDDSKRPLFSGVVGVAGTILSILGILNFFAGFLNFLAATLPAIMGVALMDYFVICKGKPHKWSPLDGVNWAGFISWIAGATVGMAFPNFFLPVLNAIIVTSVLYLILYPLFYKNKSRGQTTESSEAVAN